MEHFNIKIFASRSDIDLGGAIPVFHRWIQESLCPELLIDVADYRHVPEGPGVVLVAHEANYSLDLGGGRLGLLYNRKAPLGLDVQGQLKQAFGAAIHACALLEQEAPFQDRLIFDAGQCEVIVNDRLLAPNCDASWAQLEPELLRFFTTVYGRDPFEIVRLGEPRERLRAGVFAQSSYRPQQLISAFA